MSGAALNFLRAGLRTGWPDVTERQANILRALADHHNSKTGRMDPGLDELAADTRISTTNVSRDLTAVVGQGVLRQVRGGGRWGKKGYAFVGFDNGVETDSTLATLERKSRTDQLLQAASQETDSTFAGGNSARGGNVRETKKGPGVSMVSPKHMSPPVPTREDAEGDTTSLEDRLLTTFKEDIAALWLLPVEVQQAAATARDKATIDPHAYAVKMLTKRIEKRNADTDGDADLIDWQSEAGFYGFELPDDMPFSGTPAGEHDTPAPSWNSSTSQGPDPETAASLEIQAWDADTAWSEKSFARHYLGRTSLRMCSDRNWLALATQDRPLTVKEAAQLITLSKPKVALLVKHYPDDLTLTDGMVARKEPSTAPAPEPSGACAQSEPRRSALAVFATDSPDAAQGPFAQVVVAPGVARQVSDSGIAT